MARPGISFEQVAIIADAITESGIHPTIEKIRTQLGTGSPNTIHRHLSLWRSNRQNVQSKPVELPSSIAIAIAGEIDKASAAARAEIENRLQELQVEATALAETGEIIENERDLLANALSCSETA